MTMMNNMTQEILDEIAEFEFSSEDEMKIKLMAAERMIAKGMDKNKVYNFLRIIPYRDGLFLGTPLIQSI